MTPQAMDNLTATMVSLASGWFEDHLYRYLERLEDNFRRRALTCDDDTEQAALLKQQKAVKSGQDDAFRQFIRQLQQNIGHSRGVNASHPQLLLIQQRVDQLGNETVSATVNRLCHAISPVSLLAGFQHMLPTLKLDKEHHSQSLALFNVLILKQVPALYTMLLRQVPRSSEELRPSIDAWINHIEQQLAQDKLSPSQRALNELRLRRLQTRRQLEPANTTDSAPVTDDQLIHEATAIFYRHGAKRRQLPPSVLASLNTLQTHACGVALAERELFLNPLHPVRQISHQLVSSAERWEQAEASHQQVFDSELKQIARLVSKSPPSTALFCELQDRIDRCCQQLVQSARVNDRRKTHSEAGKRRITRLRRKVHGLIDRKTHNVDLPASIDNLLYGPVTTILLYHWLRHGSNSDGLRRNLQLVDDILWYITPHQDWALLRRAKLMSADLERNLLEGLERINVDPQSARSIVNELHQLRLLASGMSKVNTHNKSL